MDARRLDVASLLESPAPPRVGRGVPGVSLPNPFSAPSGIACSDVSSLCTPSPETRAAIEVRAWLWERRAVDPLDAQVWVALVGGGYRVDAWVPAGPFRQRYVALTDPTGKLISCEAAGVDRGRAR